MSWIREQKLLRLIQVLWTEMAPNTQSILLPYIEDEGMLWALQEKSTHLPTDLLTEREVASELGLTVAAVRNWPRRYNITLNDGLYVWGDVQLVLMRRKMRNAS